MSEQPAVPSAMDAPPSVDERESGPPSTATVEPPKSQPSFAVYRPPAAQTTQPLEALPDSYFTPTAADLQAAQAKLSAQTQSLVNAPLLTKAIRDERNKAKLDRWPNTKIRVRFTDRTQLEKVFPSTDKIRSVYAFVRSSLREDVKPIKFVLYQPPSRDLKVSDLKVRDLTLGQLELAPSSVLLLRFEDDALNRSDVPAPLASEIIAQAVDLPAPVVPDETKQSSTSKSTASNTNKSTGEKKIPKWFKMKK